MLSIEALESARPLAERFDQKRFIVTPRQDTPLELLVVHSRAGDDAMNGTSDTAADGVRVEIDSQQMALSAAAKDPIFETSAHDEVLDQVAGVCIPAVQGHIKFAKEVVAPAIDELVTCTTEAMASMTPSKLLGMEVEVQELPAPLTNSSFDTMVRKFEETPLNSPALTFNLPDQTGAELLEIMKTGSGSLDSDIEQFAATLGDGCLIAIWRDVFQIQQLPLEETRPKRFVDFLHDPECGLDNSLVIFLLARKLVENPLDGITMGLQAYETLMADYRDQAGAHLCRELNAFEEAEHNGAMVISYTTNRIVVNASIYRKWVESGGDNDVLFGNLLQATPYVMVADIDENAPQLSRAWQNHAALVATVECNKRFARTKEVLCSVFHKQMAEAAEEEQASGTSTEVICNKFDALLDDACEDDFECLYTLCLKLVCRSRFAKTEAERILGGIDRIKRKNPTLDIREAACISVLEYIAWWVANQMQVTAL